MSKKTKDTALKAGDSIKIQRDNRVYVAVVIREAVGDGKLVVVLNNGEYLTDPVIAE